MFQWYRSRKAKEIIIQQCAGLIVSFMHCSINLKLPHSIKQKVLIMKFTSWKPKKNLLVAFNSICLITPQRHCVWAACLSLLAWVCICCTPVSLWGCLCVDSNLFTECSFYVWVIVRVCVCGGVYVGKTGESSCDRCEASWVLPTIKHTGLFIKTEEAARDTLMCSLSDLCMSFRC